MDSYCFRCRNRIDLAEGYMTLVLGKGDTALEQLRSYRPFYFCMPCREVITAWLGFPPEPPELPEPEADEPVPEPPFSCHDERLDLWG